LPQRVDARIAASPCCRATYKRCFPSTRRHWPSHITREIGGSAIPAARALSIFRSRPQQ
jgi:hypothetical protein